jgi:hypothetical protein
MVWCIEVSEKAVAGVGSCGHPNLRARGLNLYYSRYTLKAQASIH